MKRRTVFAAFAISAMAAATLWAAGQAGVVHTVDGQTYEGEVVERGDQIVIRRFGIDTVVDKTRVSSVDYSSYADRFTIALGNLAADDVAGRVALAREAFDRHEYALSLRALDAALEINPLDHDARQLEMLVSSQVQLEGHHDATPTTRPGPTTRGSTDTRPGSRRTRGLDDDQINRVRQLEMRRDDRVRIQFRSNVRKRFVESQPGLEYRAFSARNDMDQAMTIFEKGDRAMIDDVVIVTDPLSIHTFGARLQTALIQGCATSNCHGGDSAGRFRLMAGTPDPATAITNFYLVNSYEKQIEKKDTAGIFAPTAIPMVSRGDAKNSLLYQYALPRRKAKLKHPEVKNWDGLIRDDNDRLAREIVGWMNDDLVRLTPDYGFTFTLAARHWPGTKPLPTEPDGDNTTQPTTAPDATDDQPTTRPAQ